MSKEGELLECIWFRNLKSRTGAVMHGGDNRTGEGEGDKEKVFVDLELMEPEAHALFFVLNRLG